MKEIAEQTGSLQCALYCTDEAKTQAITAEINEVGIPVASNFIGFAFANELAAFSDFHGPLGSPEFISGRFRWVSNRGFGVSGP